MNVKLLIIETGNFFRHNLGTRFQGEGFCLFFAERLADAKKIIAQKKIDVALLDLSGLKTEGLRILKTIKGVHAATEIITINNAEQMALSIDGMKLGAFDDFLTPVDIQALIERIRAAADNKKQSERKKPTFLEKCQNAMVAAAFAEAGEAEQARTILKHGTRGKEPQKGDHYGK